MAMGKLNVTGGLAGALTIIGLFSIKVIKLACWANISNNPLELVEVTDSTWPSNRVF